MIIFLREAVAASTIACCVVQVIFPIILIKLNIVRDYQIMAGRAGRGCGGSSSRL